MRLFAALNDSPIFATIAAPIVCHPRVQTWAVGTPRCQDGCVDLLSSDSGPWTWCTECFHRVA